MAFAGTDRDQNGKPDIAAMYQDFIAKLAANLGVGEDQVKDALEATKGQMVDEAVQKGELTQEQADKMKSGEGFGFFGVGPGRGHGPDGNPEAMAGILGMTADELKAQLEAGQKIDAIVTAQGMTMDQFREKMDELRQAEIAKAVADGKMTQEQADQMLQHKGPHPHNNDNRAPVEGNN
jgi:polyhydroxyalkanoate synthesis regulator phasin